MSEYLLALKTASERQGIKIKHLIFDNALQKPLFQASKGSALAAAIAFSKQKLG
jgi:hypothetical protein